MRGAAPLETNRSVQTGSSEVETQPRAVDEVEDLIDGDAAGMLWGRSGPSAQPGGPLRW
jgi:hypothetical protein